MNKPVFKTQEGRQKILDYYKKTIAILPVEYTEQFVETSFGRTYTLQTGSKDKPAVIMLHGSSSNSTMWMFDIAELFKDHFVVCIDIIGEAGNSEPVRLDLNTEDYAKWLDEVIGGLNIDKPSIVGNSYGGWLALKYASVFPDKLRSIVLIASSGLVNVKLKFVLKTIIFAMRGDQGIKALHEYVFGTKEIPKEVLEVSSMIMKNFNPMIGGLPVFSDEQLSRIAVPVLFIAGENDVTMDAAKAAQRLSKTVEFQNSR